MTESKNSDNTLIKVTKAEKDLIDLCHEIGYGRIKEIIIQNGHPILVTIAEKNRKLG